MSKKAVRRILATVLAFTMMWGMCLSVSAASFGGATSCIEACNQISAWSNNTIGEYTHHFWSDMSEVNSATDVNSLEAGWHYSMADKDKYDQAFDTMVSFMNSYGNCECSKHVETWGDECDCQETYNAWVEAALAFEAVDKVYSDGSKYVENDIPCEPVGPCTPSAPSNDASTGSSSSNEATVEEVVKTPENDLGTFMEATTADVTKALEQINAAVAAGDAAKAEALKTEGVTIDTGVWHSYNLSVYEQIEKSGIPVTLTFTYDHMRWRVTIPAGAKVTELCDENGWCGFLNLAAHYGFELI